MNICQNYDFLFRKASKFYYVFEMEMMVLFRDTGRFDNFRLKGDSEKDIKEVLSID